MRDRTSVLEIFRKTDVVVHAAALHGIHLDKYATDDFWDLNVAGTHNVYEAARELGIGKILLCSTMGVYGKGLEGDIDPSMGYVHVLGDAGLVLATLDIVSCSFGTRRRRKRSYGVVAQVLRVAF